MIFDDYEFHEWKGSELPLEAKPKIGIDSFIRAFKNHVEIIHRGYQIILNKL